MTMKPTPLPSSDWPARSLASVWHPCTQMQQALHQPPVSIARAQGAWLYPHQGPRLLDAVSSWWTNLLGHSHPVLVQALKQQLDQLDHVMLAGLTHEPVVELSECLARLTGLGHAFYASDGASSVEIALKMSMHSWRNRGLPHKHQFVALTGGYHGESAGALGVTDIPLFREAYAPLVRPAMTVPCPDPRQRPPHLDAEAWLAHCVAQLQACFEQHAGSLAALILEPLVQGAAGMAMYPAEYLRQVRRLCDEHDVHWIADEIAVGFGRTGRRFAYEHAEVKPDLVCLSKGLTGGMLPLAAVLCTDAIYEAFLDDQTVRGFLHSHSYTGNPLACRAALATQSLLDDAFIAQLEPRAQAFHQQWTPLWEDPRVENVRRCGFIWAMDVRTDHPKFSRDFHAAALAQGLLLRPIGRTLYWMPPYVLDEEAAQHLLTGVTRVMDQLLPHASHAATAAGGLEPGLA